MKLFQPSKTTADYVFNGHAGAGPSSAKRWMSCTRSLGMSNVFLETLTDEQAKEYAAAGAAARQGTTAHEAAEAIALARMGRISPEALAETLDEMEHGREADEAYSETMGGHLEEYLDLIEVYRQERGDGAIRLESRLSAIIPLVGNDCDDADCYTLNGTADLVVEPGDRKSTRDLVIGDLKYGMDAVDVVENPQLRIYAIGYLSSWGFLETHTPIPRGLPKTITYHIIQPREGGISTWTETTKELIQWRDEVLSPALTAALGGPESGAVFNPTEDNCQWCPARGTCAALATQRLESANDLFDAILEADSDGVDSGSLSDDELGNVLGQALSLVSLAEDLKAEANRRLLRGTKVPGFKLVSYTPPRRWKPEAEEALLEAEDVWESRLVSPAKAIKAFGDQASLLEDLIDTPSKRPVTAPEKDRRKEWTGADPEDMFDVEGGA